MVSLEKSFFLNSLQRYLSDISISLTILLFFSLVYVFDERIQSIPNSYLLFILVLTLMVAYPIGLLINAISFIVLSPAIRGIEKIIFNDKYTLLRYLNNYTREIFNFDKVKRYYNIVCFDDYVVVLNIIDEMDYLLERINKGYPHVRGIKRYLRNIVLVMMIFLIHFLYQSYKDIYYLIYFFITVLTIMISIYICAILNFHKNVYGMYLIYILLNTTICPKNSCQVPCRYRSSESSELKTYRILKCLTRHYVRQ